MITSYSISVVPYPCLLVRQVDQFGRLENGTHFNIPGPCQLGWQVKKFEADPQLAPLPVELAGGGFLLSFLA
jgi:hypothetical protein